MVISINSVRVDLAGVSHVRVGEDERRCGPGRAGLARVPNVTVHFKDGSGPLTFRGGEAQHLVEFWRVYQEGRRGRAA